MADPERLSAEQRAYIEHIGVYFEHYGLPRLVGRLLGLLMLSDRPLTLDDMAQALLVSRASVSTNIRIALANRFASRIGIAGDRRDFYTYADDIWERRALVAIEASKASHAMAEQGLATLSPDDIHARERLEEMRDYCDFTMEESLKTVERWRERKRARRAILAAKREAYPVGKTNHDDITRASVSDGGLVIEREG